MNLATLSKFIVERAETTNRHVVAIAGPPGAGKSTLADELNKAIVNCGEQCAIVPMDGFHLDNTILQNKGLLDRKGAPETFDASGFVHLVKRLSAEEDAVYVPVFDRDRDIAIAGSSCIDAKTKILLVEGNYLFLNSAPWRELGSFWDTSFFINPGMEIIQQRLEQRWLDQGLSQEQSETRVLANDIPNAKTVLQQSALAAVDVVIDEVWDRST